MRKAFVVASALLVLCGSAVGQPSPEQKAEAQKLARRAVELLNRGEDLTDPTAKRAAYSEGLALAEQAVELDHDNADAHFAVFGNRGRILLLDGTVPNPVSLLSVNRDLDRALELDPNHSDALAAKGGLYRQLPWALGGSLSRAETCLTKAIAVDPNAVGARIELAATYRDMGKTERCRPLLEKALAIAERDGKQRQRHEAEALMKELSAP
ncbi:MAG: TRAP transporter TatT component family protein [Deltaproteobacteria bacterium]|nr:TRAP transporter TatT component family protein [Deltaproteobacteria bacterium]